MPNTSWGNYNMTEQPASIAEFRQAFHNQYAATAAVELAFGDHVIEVSSNSSALVEYVRSYYTSFVSHSGQPQVRINAYEMDALTLGVSFTPRRRPAGKELKEEYANLVDGRIVRKLRTGMVFMFNDRVNIAAGPCQANPNQVINFIDSRYMNRLLATGGLLMHAAGVDRDGRGLALAGTSTAGKSTLALHLLSKGFSFISNDRLVIAKKQAGIEMHGLAKLPRVNPGTILHNANLSCLITDDKRRRYASMPPAELWRLEDKYDVDLAKCFNIQSRRLQSTMRALVILNWRRTAGTAKFERVELAGRPDLLDAVSKAPGAFAAWGNSSNEDARPDEEYVDVLRNCPVYEVTGAVDFAAAVEECERILQAAHHE